MTWKRVLLIGGITLGVLGLVVAGIVVAILIAGGDDPFAPLYADNCSVCHGANLEGAAQGPALVGNVLVHGDSVAELTESIAVFGRIRRR